MAPIAQAPSIATLIQVKIPRRPIFFSELFQIRPFRQAHFNRDKDRELVGLTQYLKQIADVEDFANLNHRKWERYGSVFNDPNFIINLLIQINKIMQHSLLLKLCL